MKTAVLILMIGYSPSSNSPFVQTVYFQSMEACEAVIPDVLKQANDLHSFGLQSNAKCYEEAQVDND